MLQSNRLRGTLPLAIGALTNLQSLNLVSNDLSGPLPDIWGNLRSLTSLGLVGNAFFGALPPSLVAFGPQLANFATLNNPPVTVCAAGLYSTGQTVADSVSGSAAFPGVTCAPCSPGTVSPAPGALSCAPCPQNTFGLGDGIACSACPSDAILPAGSPLAANCTCRGGYGAAIPSPDAAGGLQCAVCGSGSFSDGSGGPCAPCPDGSTSPPASSGIGACTCPDGSHPPLSGCPSTDTTSSSAIIGGVLGGAAGAALLSLWALRRSLRARAAAAQKASGWRAVVAAPGEVVLGAPIGRGGFGTVYEVEWKGSHVAVKELSSPQFAAASERASDEAPAAHGGWRRLLTRTRRGSGGGGSHEAGPATAADPSFVREVEFLSKLRHPNSWLHGSLSPAVLAVYAVQLQPRALLIMELGTGGSLDGLLGRTTLLTFNWLQRVTLGVGVASGVALRSFEPCVAAGVPPPLADLLRSLLAVAPWARPSADAARVALAGLAAEALSWPTSGGGAQTASPARWHQQEPGRSLTLVAFDVEGVDPLIGGTRDGAIE